MHKTKQKIIIIIGPTASGKTNIAVQLAHKIHGEIISADSRQVFKGMDIGSGKDLDEYGSIKYHLIDIREAGAEFSVSDFQKHTLQSLHDITSKAKIPIICGGTGFYIKALIEDYQFDKPPSDKTITDPLEKLDRSKLYQMLESLGLWHQHHWESDSKRRIARAIESHLAPAMPVDSKHTFADTYQARIYYKQVDRNDLKSKIIKRLDNRLKQGLIKEVESLLNRNISLERLERYGLEYKWIARYLNNMITYDEMFSKLTVDICRYAKRQMTFIRYLAKQGHLLIPITEGADFFEEIGNWLDI